MQKKIRDIKAKRSAADQDFQDMAAELEELNAQTAEITARANEGNADKQLIQSMDNYLSRTSEVARECWMQVLHVELQKCCKLLQQDAAHMREQGIHAHAGADYDSGLDTLADEASPSITPKNAPKSPLINTKNPTSPKATSPKVPPESADAREPDRQWPCLLTQEGTGTEGRGDESVAKKLKLEPQLSVGDAASPDAKRQRTGSDVTADLPGDKVATPASDQLVSATKAATLLEQFKAISQVC